jgi:hypothetical protein
LVGKNERWTNNSLLIQNIFFFKKKKDYQLPRWCLSHTLTKCVSTNHVFVAFSQVFSLSLLYRSRVVWSSCITFFSHFIRKKNDKKINKKIKKKEEEDGVYKTLEARVDI